MLGVGCMPLVGGARPPRHRLLGGWSDYFPHLCRYLLEPRRNGAVRPSAVSTGDQGTRPMRVNRVRVTNERDIRTTRAEPSRIIAGASGAALAAVQEAKRDLMLLLHRTPQFKSAVARRRAPRARLYVPYAADVRTRNARGRILGEGRGVNGQAFFSSAFRSRSNLSNAFW
jgi:hypothetical protein